VLLEVRGYATIIPYPGNLEQNGKDFNEEAQKTPAPNLAICGWVLMTRPKACFGDLFQRIGW
jgi:hypothetical protein